MEGFESAARPPVAGKFVTSWLVKVTARAGGEVVNKTNNETKQQVKGLSKNLLSRLPVIDGKDILETKSFHGSLKRTAVHMFKPNTIIGPAETFVNLIGLGSSRRRR